MWKVLRSSSSSTRPPPPICSYSSLPLGPMETTTGKIICGHPVPCAIGTRMSTCKSASFIRFHCTDVIVSRKKLNKSNWQRGILNFFLDSSRVLTIVGVGYVLNDLQSNVFRDQLVTDILGITRFDFWNFDFSTFVFIYRVLSGEFIIFCLSHLTL